MVLENTQNELEGFFPVECCKREGKRESGHDTRIVTVMPTTAECS